MSYRSAVSRSASAVLLGHGTPVPSHHELCANRAAVARLKCEDIRKKADFVPRIIYKHTGWAKK